jgi:hypothetical protein
MLLDVIEDGGESLPGFSLSLFRLRLSRYRFPIRVFSGSS